MNRTRTKRPEILLVGFDVPELLLHEFRAEFPEYDFFAAKTAGQGLLLCNPAAVVPVYLLSGYEFDVLCIQVEKSGADPAISCPLLADGQGMNALAEILFNEYRGAPVLFAGHGTAHTGCAGVYVRLEAALHRLGYESCAVGVLEGQPDFAGTVQRLVGKNLQEILLAPLTLTAGKHVREDFYGTGEESWCNRLAGAGFSVCGRGKALLELPAVRKQFLTALRQALKGQQRFRAR